MHAWMALLLATAALAGCLGEPDPAADNTTATSPLEPTVASEPEPSTPRAPEETQTPGATEAPEPDDGSLPPPITTRTRLTGFTGGEPTIGITATGTLFATAEDLVIRSTDGGSSWERVYAFGLAALDPPADPMSNNDPMLWVDPADDRVYNAPMWPALACVQLAWSDDEGASWMERPFQCNQLPNMDHQWLAGGPRGTWDHPLDLQQHDTVLYLCYNTGLGPPQVDCAVSYDGGLTFPTVSVVHEGECLDGSGRPVVAPDGTAIVAAGNGCSTPHVGISTDGGQSWDTVALPGSTGIHGSDPRIALDDAGTLYITWTDADFLVRLAHAPLAAALEPSAWTVRALDVGSITSGVFPTIVAGAAGRVVVAVIGTTEAEGEPSFVDDSVRWHLHLALVEQASTATPQVRSVQVTPDDDPVQIGCIWLRGIVVSEEQPVPEISECRNLLDFIDAVVAPNGAIHVAYTDGCASGCAGRPDASAADSRDQQVAWATVDDLVLR